MAFALHRQFSRKHLVLLSLGYLGHVASVSSSTLATDTAFSRATRNTLLGSMIPASTRSHVFLARSIEAIIALACDHAGDDHSAIDGRVFCDLTRRHFESAFQNLDARPFITVTFRLFLLHALDTTQ